MNADYFWLIMAAVIVIALIVQIGKHPMKCIL